jgi:predicted Ser/Thr protein kinase
MRSGLPEHRKVSLLELLEEPYRRIICYPTCGQEELEQRIEELRQLRINSIEFEGRKKIFNVPVLGKGCVGIVVAAYSEEQKIALKIRRIDADRQTMAREAEMLKTANNAAVGPRLLGNSSSFLMMEYVDGTPFPEWIRSLPSVQSSRLDTILSKLLEQARRLDQANLDHGELSNAPKHIIINPEDAPYIVDFETASRTRHVANVTSICQYLFIGSPVAQLIRKKLTIDSAILITALKAYKTDRTEANFQNILTNVLS